jgi:hypothetical protein
MNASSCTHVCLHVYTHVYPCVSVCVCLCVCACYVPVQDSSPWGPVPYGSYVCVGIRAFCVCVSLFPLDALLLERGNPLNPFQQKYPKVLVT